MTHHFMHDINSKQSEKEVIGAIVQGFTCLAAPTTKNLVFEDLEYCPTSVRVINDDQKHKPQYINKIVYQIFPKC
jgi:hypothetical protein